MKVLLNKLINFNFYIQLLLHIYLFFLKYSKLNNQLSFMTLYNAHMILFVFSCLLVLLVSHFFYYEILFLISVIVFLVFQFYLIRDYTWISTLVSLVTFSKFSINKIMKIISLGTLLAFFSVLILYFIGHISEFTLIRDGSIRHSFGFSHPNFLGTIIFLLFFQYLFLYGRQSLILNFIIFALSIQSILHYTGSRNAAVSLLVGYFLYSFSKKLFHIRIIQSLTMALLPLSFILSWYASAYYNFSSVFWNLLDKLLSGRIRFANLFYQESPPNFFGNKLEMITTEKAQQIIGASTKILDNAYMSILLKYGFVTAMLVCILYFVGTKKILASKRKELLSFVIVFIIYGFSESYFAFYEINFSMILCYYYIFNPHSKDEQVLSG